MLYGRLTVVVVFLLWRDRGLREDTGRLGVIHRIMQRPSELHRFVDLRLIISVVTERHEAATEGVADTLCIIV